MNLNHDVHFLLSDGYENSDLEQGKQKRGQSLASISNWLLNSCNDWEFHLILRILCSEKTQLFLSYDYIRCVVKLIVIKFICAYEIMTYWNNWRDMVRDQWRRIYVVYYPAASAYDFRVFGWQVSYEINKRREWDQLSKWWSRSWICRVEMDKSWRSYRTGMVQKRARIYNIILCTFESSFLTEISERLFTGSGLQEANLWRSHEDI